MELRLLQSSFRYRFVQLLPTLSKQCVGNRMNKVVMRGSYTQPEMSSLNPSLQSIHSSVVSAALQQRYETPLSKINLPLAYEKIQGPLLRFCDVEETAAPTIVLVHGILGSKKNLQGFAKRLLDAYPSWQAILVDLRCHGDSHNLPSSKQGPNNVESAASDILKLLNALKIFPRILIGHSFGGKVVMSMAQQFGSTLPRPVHAWVLDTLPGDVAPGRILERDHPFDLIKAIQALPLPIYRRSLLIDYLNSKGFSSSVSSWMTTNLLRSPNEEGFVWNFDLNGIEELYKSYETSSLWPLLYSPPEGLKIDFIRAEQSQFRWTQSIQRQIEGLGHKVHLLKNAGHWVHADNPEGLFQIIRSSMNQ